MNLAHLLEVASDMILGIDCLSAFELRDGLAEQFASDVGAGPRDQCANFPLAYLGCASVEHVGSIVAIYGAFAGIEFSEKQESLAIKWVAFDQFLENRNNFRAFACGERDLSLEAKDGELLGAVELVAEA